MSLSKEEYVQRFPEQYHNNIVFLNEFIGNRTKIEFIYGCGCKKIGQIKEFTTRNIFNYCYKCTPKSEKLFICKYCKSEFTKQITFEKCQYECENKYKNLIENEDYIICKICNYHGQSLGGHIKKHHNISIKNYEKQYSCSVICNKSSNKYSSQNGINGNYVNKSKEKGIDLTEYWKKVSDGVRGAILSNPDERQRRSEAMIKLNDKQQIDSNFQKIVSNTAKLTSARPDIIIARSEKLRKWREENPEDFHTKCISKMIGSFQSKPEKMLFEFVSSLENFIFKRNQFIKSENFSNMSKRRQIDMIDKDNRIYLEFDGIFHFKPKIGDDVLLYNKIKDMEVQNHIINNNWTLIRISYDQFKYSTKMVNKIKQDNSYFKQEALDKLVEILNSKVPGVYKIGEAYGQY